MRETDFNNPKEKIRFVEYEIDRLYFALDRDVSKPIPVFAESKKGETDGRLIQKGTISSRQLKNLRGRVLFSVREEMGMIGEVGLADRVIFHPESLLPKNVNNK